MNKKTTGILAGTAGAALLIGGGTFALWNDAANVGGGTITTGNLDIQEIEGGWSWVDLSEDRSDAGHEIADLDERQAGFSRRRAGGPAVPAAWRGCRRPASGRRIHGISGQSIPLQPWRSSSWRKRR